MKKVFLSMFVAMMATVAIQAQQIAVVSGSTTSTYKTLAAAIEAATAESVIYLPGGGFPISDEVKITKKLTIIGIGYNAQADNADGRTLIAGNLWFNEGSSGSAVMGCYINGNVNIGDGNAQVDDVLIKYCNLKSVQVKNSSCLGTEVNQNLIRGASNFSKAPATITNNIMNSVAWLYGGVMSYNVVTSNNSINYSGYSLNGCDECVFSYNIFLDPINHHNGDNCQATGNMFISRNWGDDCVNLGLQSWSGVFENNSGVNPVSRYHFTEDYQQYEGIYGIYGGEGFSDGQLPPVPYISSKTVPKETDASGNLHINITVNAK